MWFAIIVFTWNNIVAVYYDHDPKGFAHRAECIDALPGLTERAQKDEAFGDTIGEMVPDGEFVEVQPQCIDKPPSVYEQELRDNALQRRST
jgi:hypothetical protein